MNLHLGETDGEPGTLSNGGLGACCGKKRGCNVSIGCTYKPGTPRTWRRNSDVTRIGYELTVLVMTQSAPIRTVTDDVSTAMCE